MQQLVNCCANIPVVTSTEAIIQDSFDLRPSTPGSSISGTIIGNDQILCGNVSSTKGDYWIGSEFVWNSGQHVRLVRLLV
jgi:hypothetical protein